MPSQHTKRFSVPKEVRRRSRKTLGPTPATRVVPDKRSKPLKHKKRIEEEENL